MLEHVIVTVNDIIKIYFKSKWTSWHCHVKKNKLVHVLRSESQSGKCAIRAGLTYRLYRLKA